MKDPITTPGKTYAVTSPNGCTVTTDDGKLILTVKAGVQDYFVAPAGKVLVSDDAASVTESFRGMHTVALAAEAGANAAMLRAEAAADSAQEDAALLGDAALKSGDNVFTGNNVFAGTIGGVEAWMLLGGFLSGIRLSSTAFDQLLPDKNSVTVLPHLLVDRPEGAPWPEFPNLEQVAVTLGKNTAYGGGWNAAAFTKSKKIKTYILQFESESVTWIKTHLRGEKSYVFVPNAAADMKQIGAASEIVKDVFFYVPKVKSLSLVETDGIAHAVERITLLGNNILETFSCTWGSGWKENSKRAKPRYFVGALPKATNVSLPYAVLEKTSLLSLLGSLQKYNASTMSAVPSLNIGVDPELEGDAEVRSALLNCAAAVEDGGKGWAVSVTGVTLTDAATFGLRRLIWVKRERGDGGWVDADGVMWNVIPAATVVHSSLSPEELGFEQFPSVEAAIEEWGLTEYRIPDNPEENLTNN